MHRTPRLLLCAAVDHGGAQGPRGVALQRGEQAQGGKQPSCGRARALLGGLRRAPGSLQVRAYCSSVQGKHMCAALPLQPRTSPAALLTP